MFDMLVALFSFRRRYELYLIIGRIPELSIREAALLDILVDFCRIDVLVDPVREGRMQSGRLQVEVGAPLDGNVAIASAKVVYEIYVESSDCVGIGDLPP